VYFICVIADVGHALFSLISCQPFLLPGCSLENDVEIRSKVKLVFLNSMSYQNRGQTLVNIRSNHNLENFIQRINQCRNFVKFCLILTPGWLRSFDVNFWSAIDHQKRATLILVHLYGDPKFTSKSNRFNYKTDPLFPDPIPTKDWRGTLVDLLIVNFTFVKFESWSSLTGQVPIRKLMFITANNFGSTYL